MSLGEEKQRLRARARAVRAAAHQAAGALAAERLKENFLAAMEAMEITTADRVVAGYWPIDGEIDVRPLLLALHQRGFTCALPVVVQRDSPLVFRRWRPEGVLEPAAFGLRQPSAEAPLAVPDIVLTPLLAFDAEGYRLGYGRAYYDRTLDALRRAAPVLTVGVAFAVQQVETLPRAPHDQRLDWIVTELSARRTG